MYRMKEPGDACWYSKMAGPQTAWQFAMETFGLQFMPPTLKTALVERSGFAEGWESGVEGNIETQPLPLGQEPNDREERMAWVVGFAAGQFARQEGYQTPFCVVAAHDGECAKYNEPFQSEPPKTRAEKIPHPLGDDSDDEISGTAWAPPEEKSNASQPVSVTGDATGGFDLTPTEPASTAQDGRTDVETEPPSTNPPPAGDVRSGDSNND